jgi:hypothetical protein
VISAHVETAQDRSSRCVLPCQRASQPGRGDRRLFLDVFGNVAENFDWLCPATGAYGHQRIAEAFGVYFTDVSRSVRAERRAPKDAMQ